MKKIYIKPKSDLVRIQVESIIAGSIDTLNTQNVDLNYGGAGTGTSQPYRIKSKGSWDEDWGKWE